MNMYLILTVLFIAIPLVAIVGGIVTGIVRTVGRHRLLELAQRERIVALERGVDPSALPPLELPDDLEWDDIGVSPAERDRRLAQGLLIGGLVCTVAGIGLGIFLSQLGEQGLWAVGLIPGGVGLALLACTLLVRADGTSHGYDRRLQQGLVIGGLVCLAAGAGLGVFLWLLSPQLWTIALVPGGVGLALLLGVLLIRGMAPGPSENARH